jgi:hypothetical protein
MLTLQLELLERRFAGNERGEASPAQMKLIIAPRGHRIGYPEEVHLVRHRRAPTYTPRP